MNQEFFDEHWTDSDGNPAGGVSTGLGFTISWQRGPLGACTCQEYFRETGHHSSGCGRKPANGAFVETIIHAAMRRLSYYEAGKFKSEHNARAIHHLAQALGELNTRTREREERGVEGTHQP